MKRVISILMVITLTLSIVTMIAFGLSENGYTYTVENGEATITAYNNSGTSITIPATLGGVPVTAIGDYAFANRVETKGADITSLSLPASLKTIGDGAFDINSTITSLSIPANVVSIGSRAFHCWIKLTSVEFGGEQLKTIGKWAFKNCHSLNSLDIPGSVEYIEEGAFSYCTSLSSVNIPDSVKSVEREAFLACTSLASVTFQNSNTGIGDNAFDLTKSSGDSRTMIVYGHTDSSASRFASAEGFTFVSIDSTPDEPDPGTGIQPAGSGPYHVKVTFTVTSGNNIKASYGGYKKEVNDSAGISLLCRAVNGTASVDKEKKWDIGTQMKTNGTYTLTASLDGFPTLLYGYLDDNRAGGPTSLTIDKLEVGSSASNYKTVWSGKISLASQFNPFGVSLDWDNNAKADYFTTPDNNNKVQSSSGAWEKPYAKTISANFAQSALDLQKDAPSASNTFTYSAIDQYGVAMDVSLCKSISASTDAVADAKLITVTAENGSGTATCSKELHLFAAGKNGQNITLTFTWKGKDSTKTGGAFFLLRDEQYTVSWLDSDGSVLEQTQEYYGEKPQKDVPEKAADDTYHYQNGRWDKEITELAEDTEYRAIYDLQEHSFVLDESRSAPSTCESAGVNVYVCSVCGYEKQEVPATISHEYIVTEVVEPTCETGGYTVLECKNCHDSYQGEFTQALGHDYSLEDPSEDAIRSTGIWNKNSTYYYTCARCGRVNRRGAYFEHVTSAVVGTVDMSNQFKPITVLILKDDEVVDSVVLQPNSDGSFVFIELEPAEYTIVFEGESTTFAEIDSLDLANGAKVDLTTNENSEVSSIVVTLGDVNADGFVDIKDVSVILAGDVYGTDNRAADINDSGAVDIVDVGILLQSDNYGSSAKHLKVS